MAAALLHSCCRAASRPARGAGRPGTPHLGGSQQWGVGEEVIAWEDDLAAVARLLHRTPQRRHHVAQTANLCWNVGGWVSLSLGGGAGWLLRPARHPFPPSPFTSTHTPHLADGRHLNRYMADIQRRLGHHPALHGKVVVQPPAVVVGAPLCRVAEHKVQAVGVAWHRHGGLHPCLGGG